MNHLKARSRLTVASLVFAVTTATASLCAQVGETAKTVRLDRDVARAHAYEQLVERLDHPPLPPLSQRNKLLLDFVELFFDDAPKSKEVLSARLRLGSISLQRLDAKKAEETFSSIAELARTELRDLRAKALFGLHQAHVLAADRESARKALATIVSEYDGESAAKTAEVAMAHLEDDAEVELGRPLPELVYGKDLDDRAISEESFAKGPRLLVFWTIAHAPSQARLEAYAREWRRLSLEPKNLVAYAVDDDTAMLRRVASEKGFSFTVLPALGDGYLHPDWLRLSITAVPTALLIDSDGRLLANDLPPDRLARLLGN